MTTNGDQSSLLVGAVAVAAGAGGSILGPYLMARAVRAEGGGGARGGAGKRARRSGAQPGA